MELVVDVGTEGARALAAHTDWSMTPTGAADQWPPALPAAWDLALDSLLPTALLVGRDRVLLYNDAFAEGLGSRHPAVFGSPALEALPELWGRFPRGRPARPGPHRRRLLPGRRLARRPAAEGPLTEPSAALFAHHLRTGSAVRDEVGDVVAVVHVVVGNLVLARPGARRRRARDGSRDGGHRGRRVQGRPA